MFDSPTVVPESVRELMPGAARLNLWKTPRQHWQPEIILHAIDGMVAGAALTAGRPLTSERIIVDVISEYGDGFEGVLQKTLALKEPLVWHLNEWMRFGGFDEEQQEILTRLGFQLQEQPLPSIESTRLDQPGGVRVWSRWRGEAPKNRVPYYGQTTEVTCGAVTALSSLHSKGEAGFNEELEANRELEIAFWRKATNLPGCEPVGLAVETLLKGREKNLLKAAPRVIMSREGPVLLEEFKDQPGEIMLRTDLQKESLRQALSLGLPIEYRFIETDEIFDLVASGKQVFLLIDLNDLIKDPTLHWVLAYDVVDDHLIISDPWVQYPNGETWADTYAVPIDRAGVDHITRVETPEFRAVIVVE